MRARHLSLRATSPNRPVGLVRVFLGVVFVTTGLMKLTLPTFGTAWSIQLTDAGIPLHSFNYWFVPIFEFLLGTSLLVGFYARLGALMTFPVMLVATYVHLSVDNPAAFPAQPQEPYAPVVMMIMALVIVVKGGGSWSRDLT